MPEELVILGRAAWKASSSFVLRGATYGSGIRNRNITEPASARSPGLLCFYTLLHTMWDSSFPQYLRWLKPCFMCKNIFPGLILPAIINGEGAVPLKPWHGYQPSLHLAWISWYSLNSFMLRLSKSHTCVCCTCGMTSTLYSVLWCFTTEEVQIHSVNNPFP